MPPTVARSRCTTAEPGCITTVQPDREIAWIILSEFIDPAIGRVYGYRLEATLGSKRVRFGSDGTSHSWGS